jgi:hypothetical protein
VGECVLHAIPLNKGPYFDLQALSAFEHGPAVFTCSWLAVASWWLTGPAGELNKGPYFDLQALSALG